MKKVLLFGGSGNAGLHIAKILQQQGYATTAVLRSEIKSSSVKNFVASTLIVNFKDPANINGLCAGYDIVISALGKSVSPFDTSRESFRAVDYNINAAILKDAVAAGVSKFIYVSAFHAEKYEGLEYFQVHQDFSDNLVRSGLNYSVIKPPAIFSAFKDLFSLAQKGQLVTLGKGDKKTNPIFEGDLAEIIVNSITEKDVVIEAGGPEVLTRQGINEIIQREIAPHKKIRRVPFWLIDFMLPVIKLVSRNMYDKMAFFTAVMKEDAIAPVRGKLPFSEYVRGNK